MMPFRRDPDTPEPGPLDKKVADLTAKAEVIIEELEEYVQVMAALLRRRKHEPRA